VLERKRRRPTLGRLDRLFWIVLRRMWPRWSDVLDIANPATVTAWHRRRWFSEIQKGKGNSPTLILGFRVKRC
jgi:hypothetical protein